MPLVSIIIPARNEEKILPRLLESLKKLTYPHFEVIVVDDRSEDRTAEVARSFGASVIMGKELPPHWNGKNWACHQASLQAKGDYLLFTDADTFHKPESLSSALSFFQKKEAALMSALPYHRAERPWEKLMGPFHALIFVATVPNNPQPRRLFAIGQYLFFSRKSYDRLGGHAAVASVYPDDLALANQCLGQGEKYVVHCEEPLFEVRMYASLMEFITGWRRNFLAGIQHSKPQVFIEVILAICGITGAGHFSNSFLCFIPALLSLALIWRRQSPSGNFSTWGIILWPFSLFIYCWVTILTTWDWVRGNKIEWKGRNYEGWSMK